MSLIDTKRDGEKATIFLKGHIDSNNAADVEAEIRAFLEVAASFEIGFSSLVLSVRALKGTTSILSSLIPMSV